MSCSVYVLLLVTYTCTLCTCTLGLGMLLLLQLCSMLTGCELYCTIEIYGFCLHFLLPPALPSPG